MTRDKFNADQGRLWLAAVVLVGLLLLLKPSGAPLGLTLYLVGAFICFFAVFNAFDSLLYILFRGLWAVLSPQSIPDAGTDAARREARWRGVLALLLTIVLVAATVAASQSEALGRPPFAETLLQLGLALVILAILAQLVFVRPAVLARSAAAVAPPEGEGAIAPTVAEVSPPKDPVQQVVDWFVLVVKALWSVVEAFFMMFVKTATTLLPTSARLGDPDKDYNKQVQKQMQAIVDGLGLAPEQKKVMDSRWLDQINWASNRANRERDANELIRWWQIVLSASIPIVGILPIDVDKTLLASLAGGLITILTSVQQFRRPEERWRHYRMYSERMHAAFWSFVNLDEEDYKDILYDENKQPKFQGSKYDTSVYRSAFEIFSQKMTELQKEDFTAFFNQVAPSTTTAQAQQGVTGQGTGQANPDLSDAPG